MTRVAGIDCGTNSVRLLVADVDGAALSELTREMLITRLGQGVDRTGEFDPAAIERTLEALRAYAAQIETYDVHRVRMVATSATRDAANRDVFVAGVQAVLGVDPEVISGEEEAHLSFVGATGELRSWRGDGPAPAPPYLVVDIGGGSTEFVLGTTDVLAARSVDVGCVRMTERHLHDDPPTAAQVAAARADIVAAVELAGSTVPLRDAVTLVGLAGSVTTVAGIALGLPAYDRYRIHHAVLTRRQVAEVTSMLLGMTRAERAAIPVMHPGRVDVIGAGALVLDTIMEYAGFDGVVVSEHDILDGIALSAAQR